ncbi:MAG: hypothetical protein ACK5LL_07930 [Suipraeoptans sp.]
MRVRVYYVKTGAALRGMNYEDIIQECIYAASSHKEDGQDVD